MREMLKIFKDICLLLLLLNGYILCEKPCAQVNSCKCEGVEKTIDLAALAIEAKDPPR